MAQGLQGVGISTGRSTRSAADHEVEAAIGNKDWPTTRLGPVEAWPHALRIVTRLILDTAHPMAILWGPDALCLYNDAFARPMRPDRRPRSLGLPARDVWPNIWPSFEAEIARVMGGGPATWREDEPVSLVRDGRSEETFWSVGFSPIEDIGTIEDTGAVNGVGGVLVLGRETTETVVLGRRRQVLIDLGDRLRALRDLPSIQNASARAVGRELRAGRVGFGEIVDDDSIVLRSAWLGAMPPIDESMPLLGYGASMLALQRAGKTVAQCDTADFPGDEPARFEKNGTRSVLSVPLFRDDRHRGTLFVHEAAPRAWSASEIAFVEAATAQTWEAMERSRSEKALRVSDERFRAAVSATGVLWTNDPEGRMAGEQPAWSALTGQTRDEYQGYGWSTAVHPDDAQPSIDAWNAAVAERRTFVFEHRVRTRGGDYRNFAIRAVPVLHANGEIREWVGVHLDITDQRAAEAELRRLNATLEADVAARTADLDRVWENSQDLQVIVDVPGIFQAVNPAVERALGWSAREMIGRSCFDFICEDSLAATRSAVDEAGGEAVPHVLNSYKHKDGGVRHISWVSARDGRLIYGSGRDVTAELEMDAALAKAEHALRQSQKMEAVGQLTSGIAHDFNNLLQGVCGSLDLIRSRPSDPERVKRLAQAGLNAADRGIKLTSQLLTFSRAQKLVLKPIDVGALLSGMRELLVRTLGGAIAVEIVIGNGPLFALGDEVQLENAVLNLAINARDAMPDGGLLTITARRADRPADAVLAAGAYVEVSVSDSGVGMAPETVARAFEPFFTTKAVGKGTGLGLSQVYGMVNQAGGSVEIESRLGAGTTVRMSIPVAGDPAAETVGESFASPAAAEAVAATVLVIDDDDDVRSFLVESLGSLGYRAVATESGPAGIAALDEVSPDVVIVDYAMPAMTGAQVAREIASRRPGVPIIFATGFSETDAIETAVGKGATLLRKPFRVDTLAATLRDALKT